MAAAHHPGDAGCARLSVRGLRFDLRDHAAGSRLAPQYISEPPVYAPLAQLYLSYAMRLPFRGRNRHRGAGGPGCRAALGPIPFPRYSRGAEVAVGCSWPRSIELNSLRLASA